MELFQRAAGELVSLKGKNEQPLPKARLDLNNMVRTTGESSHGGMGRTRRKLAGDTS